MTSVEFAAELEAFARDADRIRSVSHSNPEAFFEDRSEFVGRLRARARELRTVPAERKPLPDLRTGLIVIPASLACPRQREVRVERRGGRRRA